MRTIKSRLHFATAERYDFHIFYGDIFAFLSQNSSTHMPLWRLKHENQHVIIDYKSQLLQTPAIVRMVDFNLKNCNLSLEIITIFYKTQLQRLATHNFNFICGGINETKCLTNRLLLHSSWC